MNDFLDFHKHRSFFAYFWICLILMTAGTPALFAQQIEFLKSEPGIAQMHKVKKGETLYGIAQKYKTSITQIKRLNGMDSNTIAVGQSLLVSEGKPAVSRSASVPAKAKTEKTKTPAPVTASATTVAKPGTVYAPSSQVVAELSILAEMPPAPVVQSAQRVRSIVPPTQIAEAPASVSRGQVPVTKEYAYRQQQSRAAAPGKKDFYRVQQGDDLYSIADTYEVRPEDISSWNEGITRVRPGEVLIIYKESNATSTSATSRGAAPQYRSQGETSYNYNYRSQQQPVYTRSQSTTPVTQGPPAYYYSSTAPAPAPGSTTRSLEELQKAASLRAKEVPGTRSDYNFGYSRGYNPNTASWGSVQTAPAEYIGSSGLQKTAGANVETGRYVRFEYPGLEQVRFYAVHKTLPANSIIKMGIPNNPGYIEVLIVGKLADSSSAIVGLSPGCLQILEGAGSPATVTLVYD